LHCLYCKITKVKSLKLKRRETNIQLILIKKLLIVIGLTQQINSSEHQEQISKTLISCSRFLHEKNRVQTAEETRILLVSEQISRLYKWFISRVAHSTFD